jgi:AcrR family transcriptional regulator
MALEIIDSEGLEALTIRHLASKIGVSGAALYYHFENKDAIVIAVAERTLRRHGRGEEIEGRGDWRQWLPEQAQKLRDTLVEHPALIPVFMRQHELGVGARVLEVWIARMLEAGTPVQAVMPVLDALRFWAIASALFETQTMEPDTHFSDPAQHPLLMMAIRERRESTEWIFLPVAAAIITAFAPIDEQDDQHRGSRGKRPVRTRRSVSS